MRSARVRMALSSLFQPVQGTFGVSITPSHFYFPVPTLKSFQDKDWHACRPCTAFDFRLQEQIERLRFDLLPYAVECAFGESSVRDQLEFHFNNGFFERIDAEIAYAFVRHSKPQRIIEIGSGN